MRSILFSILASALSTTVSATTISYSADSLSEIAFISDVFSRGFHLTEDEFANESQIRPNDITLEISFDNELKPSTSYNFGNTISGTSTGEVLENYSVSFLENGALRPHTTQFAGTSNFIALEFSTNAVGQIDEWSIQFYWGGSGDELYYFLTQAADRVHGQIERAMLNSQNAWNGQLVGFSGPVGGSFAPGTWTVVSAPTPVPLPASAMLLFSGTIGLGFFRIRQNVERRIEP